MKINIGHISKSYSSFISCTAELFLDASITQYCFYFLVTYLPIFQHRNYTSRMSIIDIVNRKQKIYFRKNIKHIIPGTIVSKS